MNRQENSEFEALLTYASCGICTYEVENGKRPCMLYMTDGFMKICEGSREEIFLAYKKDRLFGVCKKEHEKVNKAIAEAILTGQEQEVTYQALTLKKQKIWCTLKLNPQRLKDGCTRLFATFFDVTTQMRNQQNLSDLIYNIPGAVCLYHFEGSYLQPLVISDRYSELLGTDAWNALSQMRDMNFKHVHPDDLEHLKEKVLEALTKTYRLDETYRSFNEKQKQYLWLNVQGKVVPQEDGSSYSYVIYTDITRDKEIEQKLRANEQILEIATKNAEVWYWNCHWRQNKAYMGERFQKEFKLPAEISDFCGTMLKKNIIEISYKETFRKMCQSIVHGAKEAEAVVKGRLADGTVHWMRFKLSNIFDENQVAQEAVGVMHFVDDMKEMERKYEIEKRHATENKDLITHCCFNVATGELIDYSGSYELRTEDYVSPMNRIGEVLASEAMDPQIKEEIRKFHNRGTLLEMFAEGITESTFEYQRTMADGRCIWVRSTFHLMNDQNGTDVLLFEYCHNINLKKTMNILTGFAVNDDYDLMGFVNMQDQKAVMIYGKNSYNPCGKDILEDDYQSSLDRFTAHAVVAEDKVRYRKQADLKQVGDYLETHDSMEFYFNVQIKNGPIQSKKVRYQKYKQDEKSIIFVQSDITQLIEEQKKRQKVLEIALENAKVASIAKTSFLSQMSHEIRTPMNAIIGMTKLAQQSEDKKEITQYLNQIDVSSQYLLGIINDILDMSRIESGKLELHPQWIDCCKVITDCVEMLKSAINKKHIRFLCPDVKRNNLFRFFLDPLRIQQIYMNLLNNAIKFTPEGGTVSLSVENISYQKCGNTYRGIDRIQVKDTGCGMSEEFLKRIFQPFEMEENEFSSQVQGTGLGLALVKSFITKMGGTIQVESALGKGSIFTFEIPYEAKKVESGDVEKEKSKSVSLKDRHVLLADDHPLNRQIAEKLLEHAAARVTTAVDGQEACNLFAASAENEFDAILMDIRMPVLNGLEAAKQIRSMTRNDAATIPIIAMTANAFDEDVQKSLSAGMNAHLAKPIEPNRLMQVLAEFIKEKAKEGENSE